MNNTKVTKRNALSYRSIKTEIRISDTEGRGLFAKKPIRKGEIVSVRGGHIITRQMEKKIKKPDGYWGYPIADEVVLGPLNTQEVESVMMFLNHSCEPNVGILGQVIFVAMRVISIAAKNWQLITQCSEQIKNQCGVIVGLLIVVG